ncbi:MAG TPA: glycosyltransferase family 87 protein [Bacteroidales bacterium]|nr:glycosyltransferase family 87 protein [Bacteroidales bacterium]HNW74366.1 glycosyltransferase family 87 protein [Bacteroidales bacterium]
MRILIQVGSGIIFLSLAFMIYKFQVKQKGREVQFLALIILLAFIFHAFKNYLFSHYFNAGYPLGTFLFRPEDRFNDFFNMINICKDNNPYMTDYFFQSNYFPLANTFFWLVSKIGTGFPVFLGYILIFAFFYFLFLRKVIVKDQSIGAVVSLVIIGLLNYPFLMNIDRGNLEAWMFLLLLAFFYFYDRGRIYAAILFLALAIAMKLFPAVFLILLLKDKKYKEILITVFIACLVTVLGLLSFQGGPESNIVAMFNSFRMFNSLTSFDGMQHNSSLFGFIKVWVLISQEIFNGVVDPATVKNAVPFAPYAIAVFVAFFVLVIFILRKEHERWKDIMCLTIIMILFPNVSFDYRLIYLFIPLGYFLERNIRTNRDNIFLLLFSFLLIPQSYIYIFRDISVSALIYPIVMILFLALMLFEGNSSRKEQNPLKLPIQPSNHQNKKLGRFN